MALKKAIIPVMLKKMIQSDKSFNKLVRYITIFLIPLYLVLFITGIVALYYCRTINEYLFFILPLFVVTLSMIGLLIYNRKYSINIKSNKFRN